MKTTLLALLLAPLLTTSAEARPFNDNRVAVGNSILQGTQEPSGIRVFRGIPFAQPPVGDLRWRPPQPPADWPGVRAALRFGPRAMQGKPAYDTLVRTDGMSEDCLYLNVWTPAASNTERLPVLVWFYGGGFQGGDGSEPRYDGEGMAQRGIVFVTVNYRLGIFGFFSHPELSGESREHASGNYGLLDQNAALQWVRRNISAFGGDAAQVTIAGQSAGSLSVCAQMASPLSAGLFARAIGESGSVMGTLTPVALAEAERTGMRFASEAGFKSLAALRAAPAEELLQVVARLKTRFPLVVDGYFFPQDPMSVFASGKQAKVPLLAGWNSREGQYTSLLKAAPTIENFERSVRDLYPDDWQSVLSAYAPKDAAADAVIQSAADLVADRFIGYSTWKWLELHAATSKQPVYRYFYAWGRASSKAELEKAGLTPATQPPRNHHARHSAEIEYAWGTFEKTPAWAWSTEDQKVSATMQGYFANFIKTGNPNGLGLPIWPVATLASPAPVMRLDDQPGTEPESHRDRYLLLDRLVAKQISSN